MVYEVEGARRRGRLKKTWDRDGGKRLSGTKTEQGGCHGWRKQIRDD